MLARWTTSAMFAVALAATPVASAFAADKAEDFAKKVYAANLFEIESSKLATERAVSPAVKDFALKMINDHDKAGKEFDAAAKAANVAIKPQLDNGQLADMDKLIKQNVPGDFEKEYLKLQVAAHKDAVKLFKDYANDGDNPQLKLVAAKMLPDLEGHLAQVEKLNENR